MADVVYEGAESDGLDQKDAERGDERDEQHTRRCSCLSEAVVVRGWMGSIVTDGRQDVEKNASLFELLFPLVGSILVPAAAKATNDGTW